MPVILCVGCGVARRDDGVAGDGRARQLADDAALGHDQHAVAEVGQLLGLGGDRRAPPCRSLQARGSGDGSPPRAPMSTPRVGSSRISTLRLALQPAADHDLLLVAAAEPRRPAVRAGRLDREVARSSARASSARVRADEAAAPARGSAPSRLARLTLKATLLAEDAAPRRGAPPAPEPTPALTASAGLRGANGLPSQLSSSPPSGRSAPIDQPRSLAAPGADEPAEAEHLAAMQIEADAAALPRRARQIAHGQHDVPRRTRCGACGAVASTVARRRSPRPAPPRQPGARRVRHDRSAVAEHGDPVAEVEDLVEPVRDVEHRDADRPRGRG